MERAVKKEQVAIPQWEEVGEDTEGKKEDREDRTCDRGLGSTKAHESRGTCHIFLKQCF
jgi:hypothetical protein